MSFYFLRISLLVSFVLCFSELTAQLSYNSPYSFYGIGLVNHKTSSLNRSLGGIGIGIQDDFNLNFVNPASYASIISPVSHIFEAGMYVESNRNETSKLTESKTNGGLTNLSYWFKFSPRWAAVVGISPYSSVSYRINTQRDMGIADDVEVIYEGSGNITQLYFGNAFQVFKNFSVGLNISYLFGSIHKYEYLESDVLPGLTYDDKVFTKKIDFDAGLQYAFKLKDKKLVMGLTLDDGLKLNGTRTGKLYNADGDTLRRVSSEDVRYTLPASAGFGLSLDSKYFLFAGDVKFENWSNGDLANDDLILQDVWKSSGAFAYKGNPDGDTYLNSVGLRGGFHIENYYQVMESPMLNWGVSTGLSFPVFDGKSSLNLTYSFDKLGTISDGMILHHSHKIIFDVVIRDFWGGKRKFD